MVGTITKTGERVRAFKVGSKVDLDFLNRAVPEEWRATQIQYKSDLTLDQAKEKYPEWYHKRINNKQKKGSWVCNRAVYDWWKKRANEVEQGHRYWFIMTLATYAIKCCIKREELEQDALDLIPLLNAKGTEPFTEDDVIHALEAYNDSYATYPIDTIVKRTGLPIEKNKRNGRKQYVHLERARAVQMIDYPNREWINKEGAPTKQSIVQKWRLEHPDGKKADCIRDTGLTKPTVYKWWKG